MSPEINIKYLLCQSESLAELEKTARKCGCSAIYRVYNATHLTLPDGQKGSFRWRDGHGFVWCEATSAE